MFRLATFDDCDRVWEIILQAKEQMYREGRHQWDESYPAYETITSDVQRGIGYVLCLPEGRVIAYAAVVFDGEPTYDSIEGAWLSEGEPFVVVHRLAVADEVKNQGMARAFMEEVEKVCASRGIHSFKIDTNFDNVYMQKLLSRCGFSYCGKVYYEKGERWAYEKLLP